MPVINNNNNNKAIHIEESKHHNSQVFFLSKDTLLCTSTVSHKVLKTIDINNSLGHWLKL